MERADRPSASDAIEVAVWLTHAEIPCFHFGERERRRLEAKLPNAAVRVAASQAEILDLLPPARVAVVWRFEEAWLERAPRLEWIATPAAGRDYFHVEPRAGLEISYGAFHGELIGETVAGMLLAHARGLRAAEILGASNPWPRRALALAMTPLRGSHVAILGFGNIGRWIGRLLKPFGVRLTGIRRTAPPRGERPAYFDESDRVVASADLDSILPAADYLVLALPAAPETDSLLDTRRLGLLPPRAVVVNVGRGNAVDEAALAAALDAGRLAAAYLDVFREEPLPLASPLRRCRNAFLMPHASAFAPNYLELFVDEFAERFRTRYGAREGIG